MSISKPGERFQTNAAEFIEREIKSFTRHSPLNRVPAPDNDFIFAEPLVQFANGDDPIFTEYKTIIDPTHLTPREALAKACNKSPEDMPSRLSVISWILPITGKIRESNRQRQTTPSNLWTVTRWYGEKFNDALRKHVVNLLTEKGYLAVAPMIHPCSRFRYRCKVLFHRHGELVPSETLSSSLRAEALSEAKGQRSNLTVACLLTHHP